jgi:hypothetical protein
MNKNLKAILLISLGIPLLTIGVYGATLSLTVHNSGYIGAVGIFSDINLTQPLANGNIAWGTVFPGTTLNQTVYIMNYAGQNVNLSMTVDNWNPLSASQYMSVSWDHEGMILAPGVAEACVIYLTVYDNATSSGISGFSFDIVINPTW